MTIIPVNKNHVGTVYHFQFYSTNNTTNLFCVDLTIIAIITVTKSSSSIAHCLFLDNFVHTKTPFGVPRFVTLATTYPTYNSMIYFSLLRILVYAAFASRVCTCVCAVHIGARKNGRVWEWEFDRERDADRKFCRSVCQLSSFRRRSPRYMSAARTRCITAMIRNCGDRREGAVTRWLPSEIEFVWLLNQSAQTIYL